MSNYSLTTDHEKRERTKKKSLKCNSIKKISNKFPLLFILKEFD